MLITRPEEVLSEQGDRGALLAADVGKAS